jgi:hypothetical protein
MQVSAACPTLASRRCSTCGTLRERGGRSARLTRLTAGARCSPSAPFPPKTSRSAPSTPTLCVRERSQRRAAAAVPATLGLTHATLCLTHSRACLCPTSASTGCATPTSPRAECLHSWRCAMKHALHAAAPAHRRCACALLRAKVVDIAGLVKGASSGEGLGARSRTKPPALGADLCRLEGTRFCRTSVRWTVSSTSCDRSTIRT